MGAVDPPLSSVPRPVLGFPDVFGPFSRFLLSQYVVRLSVDRVVLFEFRRFHKARFHFGTAAPRPQRPPGSYFICNSFSEKQLMFHAGHHLK